MTSIGTGDLLTFARKSTRDRLTRLRHSTNRFSPSQLTLLGSLLDEFERKSRADARHKADHPAHQSRQD